MRTIHCLLLALLACSSSLNSQKPQLSLPIGHQDFIANLLVSNDGKYLLTSDRSSMKLWDIKTGKLLRSNNEHGATFYFQLDTSAQYVLFVDGVTDPFRYVWDIEKDKITRVEEEWPANLLVESSARTDWKKSLGQNQPAGVELLQTVVFSSDSRYALALEYGNWYQYWDVANNKLLKRDSSKIDLTPQLEPFIMTFSDELMFVPTVFVGADGPLVTYRPAPNTIQVREVLSGRVVYTITDKKDPFFNAVFTPDGKSLITANAHTLRHWDLESGRMLKDFDTRARLFHKNPVIEPDQNGVRVEMAHGNCYWNFESGALETPPTPMLLPNPQGEFAAANSLYVTTPDGHFALKINLETDNKPRQLWDLTTQKIIIEWSNDLNKDDVGGEYFCLSKDLKSIVYAYTETYTTLKHFTLYDLANKQILSTFSSEEHGAMPVMALSPDNSRLLCGFRDGEYPVMIFDPMTGKLVKTLDRLDSKVVNLAFSPDQKYVYVAGSDLSLHVFDAATGKELTALVAIGDHDWALTSADGLFDASPGAMQALVYTVGREVIELEQLKERYYEPGLLSKIMGFSQEAPRVVSELKDVPLYPELKAAFSADMQQLEVTVTPRTGGLGKLSLFVNGKEVAEDLNPQRARKVLVNLKEYAKFYHETGSSTLALRVYNSDNWLKSPVSEWPYTPPPTARGAGTAGTEASLGAKPSLYAVVIGTANYAGEQLDLKFSDRDASAFSQALSASAPKVFENRVYITLLNTDPKETTKQDVASKASIKAAFLGLAAKAKPQDVLVVYLSGHGVNYGAAENSQFYYLTKDIASEDLKDPEIRKNYAVSSLELTEWIKSIAALKQVMIIDACNSGKIIEDFAGTRKDLNASQIRAIDRMKDRTGMFILTGSAADKVSFEAGQFGQGLLTYSLLQGMSGLALTSDKRVDVMTLFQYARDRVPVLAKGIGGVQTPMLAFPNNGASFDIGIVDAQVKIPLAQEKPVFIRNNLTEETAFDDILGLTDVLENHLSEITLGGAQAPIIFVDVKEYPDAFSLKGRYRVSGDQVELECKLFKGKTPKGDIKLKGVKSNLPGLVEGIMDKVTDLIGN